MKQLDIYQPALTPMMQQYFDIKAEVPDCLLFYRLGDFYELFGDDAVLAADILGIVLTKRGKNTQNEIAMCGVPAHSHEQYLHKLLEHGHKVAICEQLESPKEAKKRGPKAVVRREIVRIITKGTIIEENLLLAASNLFLCTLAEDRSANIAITWLDITTGAFYVTKSNANSLAIDITRFNPAEVIISEKFASDYEIFNLIPDLRQNITVRANAVFHKERAIERICRYFKIADMHVLLEGTDIAYDEATIIAIGAMLEYVEHTQKGKMPMLQRPKSMNRSSFMIIDKSSMINLNIDSPSDKKSSLVHAMDMTVTAMGARLLNLYIRTPLLDIDAIRRRQDVVEFFINQSDSLDSYQSLLKQVCDLERIMAKVFLNKAKPYDLFRIQIGLLIAGDILQQLKFQTDSRPHLLEQLLNQMIAYSNICAKLAAVLVDDMQLDEEHFIKPGYSPVLDELISFKGNSSKEVENLRDRYRLELSIPTLKISYNNMIGYFIEVTSVNAAKMDSRFIIKQSTASTVRYTTNQLQELESKINSCDERICMLEGQIFQALIEEIIAYASDIYSIAASLASLDVFISLARLAVEKHLVRPVLNYGFDFNVKCGRHLVVENALGHHFVPNDTELTEEKRICLITGPNMAGKSTYMRQNALIAVMAQMGSFVPAISATISIVDKLFSRIGAGDDIARGQSTFMLEMIEVAAILGNATDRSFIILDEIGRGTATYDGLAIAAAVLEDINNRIEARTMFSTHYHELTNWENALNFVECYDMQVMDTNGKIVFLHTIKKGKADRSYGIHVAELAGVPSNVVNRANEILVAMQKGKQNNEI